MRVLVKTKCYSYVSFNTVIWNLFGITPSFVVYIHKFANLLQSIKNMGLALVNNAESHGIKHCIWDVGLLHLCLRGIYFLRAT